MRLRELRKKKNLSQQGLAIELKKIVNLNISREALSNYECGARNPSLDTLNKLSQYFNVSIDYLINGEEFKKR